jgi:hypothetical protein
MHVGWNTCGVLVENIPVDELLESVPDVFSRTQEELDFSAAASRDLAPNFAVGPVKDWCIFWDPNGNIAWDDETISELSVGRRALAFLMVSAASYYGFKVFIDGDMTRSVVYQDHEILEETGAKAPGEDSIKPASWGYDEDAIFAMIRKFTGLGADDMEERRYAYLDLG